MAAGQDRNRGEAAFPKQESRARPKGGGERRRAIGHTSLKRGREPGSGPDSGPAVARGGPLRAGHAGEGKGRVSVAGGGG